MKKLYFIALTILAFPSLAFAQDKLLTLDDIFNPEAAKRVRFGGTPIQVKWASDSRSFMQVVGGKLMRVDAATGRAVPYHDSDAMQAALRRAGIPEAYARELADSPSLEFNDNESAILVSYNNDLWVYDVPTKALRRLTNGRDEEKEADFSPDGRLVSFVRNNNLYVVDVARAAEKQMTRDGKTGDAAILNGYLDWVYEEEVYGRGNKRGYWWSPDSKFIAFLRTDEAPVPTFTLTNDIIDDQIIETENYPQAGDQNPIVRLGIADVGKSAIVPNAGRLPVVGSRLPTSLQRLGDAVRFVNMSTYKPEDFLLVRVTWSPDSRSIYYQAQNREQTFLDLNAATLGGRSRKLMTEQTPAWVEVYDNPVFVDAGPQSGTFVWQSARNGWRHLYLCDNEGRVLRPLTNGEWEVRSLLGVDKQNGWAYFSGTKDSHIAENIYRVNLAGGEPERLSRGDGWHSASFNKDFTQYFENSSDTTAPNQTRLYNADGSLIRVLNENKVDVLRDFRLSRPEFLNVKTRDGFVMEAMMIKPPDFDPSKKYPVFQFTYSGPHSPSVANRWGGNRGMWFQMLAQKGYIVWVCDNRTASGKGQESVWPAYKRLYELELRDLEDGISYLKSLPYVDDTRIGLHGWSYGGSMTAYALTHSKSYKIGIAGGSVTDWRLYDTIYTERYMLTPQNNPDGYDKNSIIKAAGNLSGRLMLIHGAMDDNVHMQNTTQLAYALQEAGKQFDLMIYPTQRHGITNPSQVRHMYGMMTEFILKNL